MGHISLYSMGRHIYLFSMGHIYIYIQYRTYISSMGHPAWTSPHIVCDIYLYIKGTSIHTVWNISHYNMRHISTVWDIYLYNMGHLSIPYGTSFIAVWNISIYSMGHLSLQYGHIYIQYGIYIYAVRDITHYRMGHLSIQDRWESICSM